MTSSTCVEDITTLVELEEQLRGIFFPLIEQLKAAYWRKNEIYVPYKEVFLSGSLVEGCVFGRRFMEHSDEFLEVDLMIGAASIDNIKNPGLIVRKPGCNGFYHLRNTPDLLNNTHAAFKEEFSKLRGEFVSGMFIKKMILEKLTFESQSGAEDKLKRAVSYVFGAPFETMKYAYKQEITGPSAVMEIDFTVDGERRLFSCDRVMCIRLSRWPDENCAAEWLAREREWPSADMAEQLVTCCHIVPKEASINSSSLDWRMSFSEAEVRLTQTYTKKQRILYAFFKSLFYNQIKMEDGLSSFCCKTTMFYTMEAHGPTFCDAGNFKDCLKILLKNLLIFVERHHLPTFFNKQINILSSLSEQKREESCARIRTVLNKLELTEEVLHTATVLDSYSTICSRIIQIQPELQLYCSYMIATHGFQLPADFQFKPEMAKPLSQTLVADDLD